MPNRRSRWLWPVLLIVLITGAYIARWDYQRQVQAIPMGRAERRVFYTGVVTNGFAEPVEYRETRVEVEGQIATVLVRDGDEVKPGQKLIEISQKQIASDVEHARADL